jgi:hypothetical protein
MLAGKDRKDFQSCFYKNFKKFENVIGIGKSARKVPYGPMNLQKFAHFHVLSAHYIALSRAI